VQDHCPLTRQLTVDLGVRYDFERLPAVSIRTRIMSAANWSGLESVSQVGYSARGMESSSTGMFSKPDASHDKNVHRHSSK